MKVAVLTDFVNHDPAYSLCGVVKNQVKMLAAEHEVTLLVREDFNLDDALNYEGATRVVQIHPGRIDQNVVNVDGLSETEINSLEAQLEKHLVGIDVVLTHDLIYQPNQWKYHVACRRLAKTLPAKWLHFVHSATDLGVARKTGKYWDELKGAFPNSKLVAFHPEEINRKGTLYNYEREDIVVIPNPMDVMEDYHDITRTILADRFWQEDVLIVYPARLDRGKNVEVIGDIVQQLNQQGFRSKAIIIDFHSTAGDKKDYRNELRERYGSFMSFTSDIPDCEYHVPHKVVMDLMDYADVFIHPSKSEADPLTIPEAMWKRNLLMLNFDLPVFRQWEGTALMGKFSSAIDITTGMPGETNTDYGNRATYMSHMAAAIAHAAIQNPIVQNHRYVRQERSLEAVMKRYLNPILHGLLS